MIQYPTEQDIIDANKYVLETIRVRKADRHKVLVPERIAQSIESAKRESGDLYDKAVVLLSRIVKGHAFDSGNRRTAFTVAIAFLKINGESPNIIQDSSVLQGIREGFYTNQEIKSWLKGNAVRPFRRF